MPDPISELHKTLVAEGLVQGKAADADQFRANMASPESRRKLYDFLSKTKPDLVDMKYEDFDKDFAPIEPVDGSKKKDGGIASTVSSSSPSATAPVAAQPSASEPAIAGGAPNSLLKQYGSMTGPQPSSEPSRFEAPARLTGKEDPIAVGGIYRSQQEAAYGAKDRAADKYPWRKGERDLEKITLYGQKALEQSQAAEKQIGSRIGNDWQQKLVAYAPVLQKMADPNHTWQPDEQKMVSEVSQFWADLQSLPEYKVWTDGQTAVQRAQTDFNEYAKKNPDYARIMAQNKEALSAADNSAFKSWQNWAGQKLTQIVAGAASLPRTLVGTAANVPANGVGAPLSLLKGSAVNKWAQQMGDWADGAMEYATKAHPTGSGTNRPMWEKMADFEGASVVVDDKGQPVKAYKDNVEVAMDDAFAKRFSASGVAGQAERKFTGIKNNSMKLADVVSDLYVMRYLGGGTMAGTTAVAFGLQHQDAYNTAVKDFNLTPEDASTYAMISSGLSAVIESTIGTIETKPLKLAAAKAIGLKEAKALIGKASMMDVAKAAWKPYLREIGMENVEEVVDKAAQTLNNQMFNATTGSKLDVSIRPEDIAETIVMTTLATGIAGGGDSMRHGKGELHDNALHAAVLNPEAFGKVMGQLQEGGVITPEQATAQVARINRLAEIESRLPETMGQEKRKEVIALEDQRTAILQSAAGTPSEAQQKAAKKAVAAIDNKIVSLINKPADTGESDVPITEDVVMQQEQAPAGEATVAENATVGDAVVAENATTPEFAVDMPAEIPVAETAQPVMQDSRITESDNAPDPLVQQFVGDRGEVTVTENPFDTFPTEDRMGDNRSVDVEERVNEGVPDLADVAPGRDVTVRQAQESFQGEVGALALIDDATNLAMNSLFPQQRREMENNPGSVASLQQFIADNLNDESNQDRPIRDVVEGLAGEFFRNKMQEAPEKRLSRRLKPATVQDHIALAFAEGVRVRPQDITGDVADAGGQNGIQIQYTARNGTPLDLMAQDIREAMGDQSETVGMQDHDVRNEILDFIHNNPSGPGNYMRETIAAREQEDMGEGTDIEAPAVQDAVAVQSKLTDAEEAELSKWIKSYNGDMDKLLNDWENWDPFYPTTDSMESINNLSPNIISVLDERLNAIRNDAGTGETVPGSAEAVLENDATDNGSVEDGQPEVNNESAEAATAEKSAELNRPAEDGPVVLPVPAVEVNDNEVAVTNATAFADLLSDAGGVYDAQRGAWVFPADKAAEVGEILSRRRTGGDPYVELAGKVAEVSGISGQLTAMLTTPGATLKRARTKTKLKAATSFEDRLAIAQSQHAISRDRDERTNRRMLKRLKAAFPNLTVVADVETIDKVKRQLGITKAVPGFQHEGVVYVDPRYARPSTAVHEHGHIWNSWLRENDPAEYQRGADLARKSDQFEAIKSNPDYAYLTTDEAVIDEVLATAMGESGAMLGDTSVVLQFRRWVSDLWYSVGRAFGFQPRYMTLQEFSDAHAYRMLAGDEIMPETSRRIKQLEDQQKLFGEKGDAESRLQAAWAMEQAGESDENVFLATGWVRGTDGKWRWGVDSKTFALRVDEQSDIPESATVADIVDWPALFAAHPELATMPATVLGNDLTSPSVILSIQDMLTENVGVPIVSDELHEVAPEEAKVFGLGDVSGTTPKLQAAQNAGDYAARMESAREIIAAEIQSSGLKDIEAKSLRLSQAMNLDLNHVRRLWESEGAKARTGKLVLTTNDLGQDEETFRQMLGRYAGVKLQKTQKWFKAKFTPGGLLPKAIFKVDQERLGRIAVRLKQGERMMQDLEKAVEKFYGKPTVAHWQHIDNVMRGEGDWGSLPVEIREHAMNIRKFMDSISRDLVRSGVLKGEVILTVLNNSGMETTREAMENVDGVDVYAAMGKLPFERTPAEHAAIETFLSSNDQSLGNYFYRSYRKYDDPNWKDNVSPRVLAEARRFLEKQLQDKIAELDQARIDKAENFDAKIAEKQAEIDAINEAFEAPIAEMQKKVQELGDKQQTAIDEKGTRNKNIDRSIAAAVKALRDLQRRAREAKRVSISDAEALLALEDPEFQKMSVAAKQVVKKRREIMAFQDRQAAAANFKQEVMDQYVQNLQNVDGLIDEILHVEDAPASQLSRSKLGAKDLNILKGRKDIAEPIRELMGEYHDPRINFAKSMYRAVNLLENQKFLTDLRENFAGIYFIPPTEVRKGFVEISSKGSATMDPLNGWKAPEEVREALNAYFGATTKARDLNEQLFNWYVAAVAGVKYGKTILSPVTHFRNFVGNVFFVINNAYNPFSKNKLLSFKEAWGREMDVNERAYTERLIELRVLSNGAYIGSIKELLNTMNADNVDRIVEDRLGSGANKTRKVIEETYGAEDDFYRIMAFETEKTRYAKALYGQPFEQLSIAQQHAVEEKAAELCVALLPTYSMIPQIAKDLQRFPLTGTFIAFPAEMFRVTWNQYKQIGIDLSDPRTRGIGMQRLIGAAVAQIGLSAGVTALGHFLAGIDWEEDEAARRFMFPWQDNGVLLYTDFEPGKEIRFVNISYTNPYSFETKPLASLFLNWGKTWDEKMGEAAWGFVEPFFSPELTASTIGQLYYNTNERTGRPIYNPGLGMVGDLRETVKFLSWNLQPGLAKTALDLYSGFTGKSIGGRSPKAVTDVLLGFAGAQVERMNMEKVISSDFLKRAKAKQSARDVFTMKKFDLKDRPDDLKDRFDIATEEYNAALKDMGESVSAAQVLGITPAMLGSMMKDRGFSETERAAIMSGTEIVPKFEGYNK